MKGPTSRDVARVAGVSQATVSRVLSGSSTVRPDTRARVERALEATGYTPNSIARAMRTNRTNTIGVVVGKITNPFYPQLLEALSQELALADRHMNLWIAEHGGEAAAMEAIDQRLIDGVIYTTLSPDSSSLAHALRRNAPVVLVNRGLGTLGALRDYRCDQAVGDNRDGGRQVAQYILKSGHRRIALIAGPSYASTTVERELGFRERLREAGVELDPNLRIDGDLSFQRGLDGMRTLMTASEPPSVVFCVNDFTAIGALNGALSVGVSIPRDVWLIGYNDIPMSSWPLIDLTTVRQPIDQMVKEGVKLLLKRIDFPDEPTRVATVSDRLIVRGSTNHTPLV